jgi:uncharacterized membrane protein
MRFRLIVIIFVLALLLIPMNKAHCQDYIQYKVQINGDNSATWTVTLVSDVNASIDSLDSFQQKVATLVDAARNGTHREMTIDPNSLQMVTTISWETQSKTTEYVFTWQNFSMNENDKIMFGDVFRVAEFFGQLYGGGTLQIGYPPTYTVDSVTPTPNVQNDTLQTLEWFRTQDFIKGNPRIVLTNKSPNQSGEDWQKNAIIILGSVTAVATSLIGFYLFKRQKREKEKASRATSLGVPLMEGDEEKIVRIIKSSGGSLHQSTIAEQCRFSKAKTSQLLAALEQKGVVRRYKKGRDKIVTLAVKDDTS